MDIQEVLILANENTSDNIKFPHINYDMYNNSNIFSKLLFYWSLPAMHTANQTSLKISHLGGVDKDFNSEIYFSEIKKIWYGKEDDRTECATMQNAYCFKKRCPLFRAVIRSNRMKIMLIFLFGLIYAVNDQLGIFWLRQVVLVFQIRADPKGEKPLFNIYVTILLLLFCKAVNIFVMRHSIFLKFQVGIKGYIQLTSLIYDKLFKLGVNASKIFTEGEITNLIQIDAEKFIEMINIGPENLLVPLQVAGYLFQLFYYFGISFLSGVTVILIIIVLVGILQSKYRKIQSEVFLCKDQRMRITAQTFNILKMIKLYAWEDLYTKKIYEKRAAELSKWRELQNINVFIIFLYWSTPLFLAFVSILFYNMFNAQMNIANISAAIAIFLVMTWPINLLPTFISGFLTTLVSMERIQKFLFQADIDINAVIYNKNEKSLNGIAIEVSNCSFAVESIKEKKENNDNDNEIALSITKTNMDKVILHDIELEIRQGELLGIIGEVGSGKSALLCAILNNMITINNSTNSHIIVNGTISYVSQTPWILNETLQNNILFFQEMNPEKYDNIIHDCELNLDLNSLAAGDQTEIGEKGINLSGGQKVRVDIARALYRDSDIYMFDDPLSSLDANVGMAIFEKVIVKRLDKKTRILVTHALQYISRMDRIIYMDKGRIHWIGTYSDLVHQSFYSEFVEKNQKQKSKKNELKEETRIEGNKCDSKENIKIARITKEEEQEVGAVKCNIYSSFFLYFSCVLFSLVILMNLLFILCKIASDYWVTYWTIQQNLSRAMNLRYLIIFSLINFLYCIFIFFRAFFVSRGELRLGKTLHEKMITTLIKAPVHLFHERIPRGQILNRLSMDLENACSLGWIYGLLLQNIFTFLGSFIVCTYFYVYSIIFLPILLVISIFLARFYISAGRDLNRLEGISRSPIIGNFAETIHGVTLIRAYHYEETFKKKLFSREDDLYKVLLFSSGCNHWLGIRLELISFSLLIFIMAFIYFFPHLFSSQSVGLMITYSISITSALYYLVNQITYVERLFVSLERCNAYTKIIQEKPYEKEKDMELKGWPSVGSIIFENYSVKYRPELDVIALKNLNCYIRPGEKVGIVGRTGSGKSTFCLALLRDLERLEGRICIDGVDIQEIGLKKLRESITFIPQDPTLIEGTLRENIDPLGQYTEEECIYALQKVGLNYLLEESRTKSRIECEIYNTVTDDITEKSQNFGLNLNIKENGSNLSVGEKQLISLTRAFLRKNKIVVMDEATSSLDMKTESLILEALRSTLSESTVITIAHRIKTIINYDRIFVLDEGKLIENDTPENLLKIGNGLFAALYSQSMIM